MRSLATSMQLSRLAALSDAFTTAAMSAVPNAELICMFGTITVAPRFSHPACSSTAHHSFNVPGPGGKPCKQMITPVETNSFGASFLPGGSIITSSRLPKFSDSVSTVRTSPPCFFTEPLTFANDCVVRTEARRPAVPTACFLPLPLAFPLPLPFALAKPFPTAFAAAFVKPLAFPLAFPFASSKAAAFPLPFSTIQEVAVSPLPFPFSFPLPLLSPLLFIPMGWASYVPLPFPLL
mmetsp:Transcript_102201/g.256237  ORF Transcript_102201/g.256237 Transcript_102201/m.256237 type:complete len:236 (-) Transcript_102201:404-1111(-)